MENNTMMAQVGSMKHREMMRVEMTNVKAVSYGEGYSEGFSDGYDAALKNIRDVAEKCAIGGPKKSEQPEEKQLRPAVRFLHQSKARQIDKIVEECEEVVQAWNDGERVERIAEEVADLQQACETMLAMLGYTEEQRKNIRLKVVEKNSRRGYYMPPREKYGN